MKAGPLLLGPVLFGPVLLGLVLSGCGYRGVTSLPLPGAIGGAGTYEVTAVFDDATNLVPKETCRANDVTVGSVASITVGPDLRAHVTCAIQDTVALPANAVASLAETSLLGERFVAFEPPAGAQPTGRLAPGAVIAPNSTRADPDTEQVLGTLSMVLNGGSLGRVQTISTELNQALGGHETDTRGLLDQLTTLTGQLDQHRGDITHALDSLDRLSTTVADQRDVLGRALDTVPDGVRVLNDQRDRVISLLRHLHDLSDAAVPVLDESKDDTIADLKSLRPILDDLAENGRQIAPALELLSYPFPANALDAIKGDYAGLFATVNLNLNTIETLLRQEAQAPLSNRLGAAAPALPGPLPLRLPGGVAPPGSGTTPLDQLLLGGGR
ncbi:MAG: phospholipid/cholesterol/gamma-HCH transport system substrate-binding protein [Pseudonocardiales bacterium]|nr:phospholipid/cholesterol/gamma-HCH transport system substrate-binding protein [Pseudonocardiales bacterium]